MVSNPKSPAQAGNGEFAFGVDITGLQTFVPFNTLSQWSWHSFPLPGGINKEDFKGVPLPADDRMINFFMPDKDQPELSEWLAGNPHRFNLGRIEFVLIKSDGSGATEADLKNCRQETDLWEGIIYSSFELEGEIVRVKTACHPSSDALGFSVTSDLIRTGQIKILIDFPYADSKNMAMYLGDYFRPDAHSSIVRIIKDNTVEIKRTMDDAEYYVAISWTTDARFLEGDTITSPHRFYLDPSGTDKLEFSCTFSKQENVKGFPSAENIFAESKKGWQEFWKSGAAIDLSKSK
ncbi:MAG: hypothetical protein HZB98_16045, partial [Bacteroidia bacterium]|nr:hypothetical protein [Bacteroidia bacterium]